MLEKEALMKEIDVPEGLEGKPSHGMCEECHKKFMGKAKKRE